jgi:formimidoylglutamate deiminase
LFSGGDAAIRDVMVAGRWVVKDRRHEAEDAVLGRFAGLLQRLGASP